jgi:hypothetical protein
MNLQLSDSLLKKTPWRGQRRSLRRAASGDDARRHRVLLSPAERRCMRAVGARRSGARSRCRLVRLAAGRSFDARTSALLPRR